MMGVEIANGLVYRVGLNGILKAGADEMFLESGELLFCGLIKEVYFGGKVCDFFQCKRFGIKQDGILTTFAVNFKKVDARKLVFQKDLRERGG